MFRRSLFYFNHISLNQVMGIVRAKQVNDPLAATKMLIDVRSTAEVAQTGMIPTAINIPLSILPDVLNYDNNDLTENDFEETFKIKCPVKGDTILIFYCAHGVRSAKAAEIAEQLGFTGALNFSGSWAEWSSAFGGEGK
ncbi:unnamed protein product [Phytomonas sp. EM1]|nr:unnamed protein product [Phytomonas sp. EM1]|eukprot:CCW64617.1 unnamed protein product [Phytomonas sp. isolate EM1]